MEKILDVAHYLYEQYLSETNERLDELKLQKLLYFVQREALAITGKPLFNEKMEGWVHGPVSPLVRTYYSQSNGINCPTNKISCDSARIVNNVFEEFGSVASWKLRNLSHDEISWKKSRVGLSSLDRGNRELSIEDIKEDSKKVRPFDYTWGMYYDEFDDYTKDKN